MARPRINLDIALILRLRDDEHLGWTRMADEYRDSKGQYISRDTIKRRYKIAKAQQASRVVNYVKVSPVIIKTIPQDTPVVVINGNKFFLVKRKPNQTPIPPAAGLPQYTN